jgi:hypothetical protein
MGSPVDPAYADEMIEEWEKRRRQNEAPFRTVVHRWALGTFPPIVARRVCPLDLTEDEISPPRHNVGHGIPNRGLSD